MRVLILTQFFEPEPIPKPMDLAKALASRGHSVCVLTGFPNYPTGKLYSGYSLRLWMRETVDGIPTIRTWLYPSHGKSVLGRVFNYGSFMVSSIMGAWLAPACDVMYVWHPPLTIGIAAWLLGWVKGIPFVYDVQDIWPESGVWSGMLKEGLFVRALHLVERFIYKRARRILVVTEGAKRNLMGKGVPREKLLVASHWIDEDLFATEDNEKALMVSQQYNFKDRFVIMYAGNMGIVQGLDTVLHAASLLRDEARPFFVFVGEGSDRDRLMRRARAMGLTNTLFIGRQPMSEIPNFMSNAHALLLPLKPSTVCDLSIPVKAFAYLAARRPILAVIEGASADLIRKAEAGIVVPPENPQALAQAVLNLMKLSERDRLAMGESGRSYLVTHHSKNKVLDSYVEMLKEHAICSS